MTSKSYWGKKCYTVGKTSLSYRLTLFFFISYFSFINIQFHDYFKDIMTQRIVRWICLRLLLVLFTRMYINRWKSSLFIFFVCFLFATLKCYPVLTNFVLVSLYASKRSFLLFAISIEKTKIIYSQDDKTKRKISFFRSSLLTLVFSEHGNVTLLLILQRRKKTFEEIFRSFL